MVRSLIVSGSRRSLFILMCALLLAGLLAACDLNRGQSLEDVPTLAPSVEELITAEFLTQNAPPEGFREAVSFPEIDANLTDLPNWRYEMRLTFDGVFAGTNRPASASTTIRVSFNQLDISRRVILEAEGLLAGEQTEETVMREGVRLGTDTFLIQGGACQRAAGGAAALLADLKASDIIGGVGRAVPIGVRATINNEATWRYDFTPEDVILPTLRLTGQGRISQMDAEMWVSPERNAVIRYWVTLQVENVVISVLTDNPDSAAPVTGQLIIRYDVQNIGVNPNITEPNNC
jgi:hypothetical protein